MVVTSFEDEGEAIRVAKRDKNMIWPREYGPMIWLALIELQGSLGLDDMGKYVQSSLHDAPFGGHRWSGFGRDLGFQAMLQYTA